MNKQQLTDANKIREDMKLSRMKGCGNKCPRCKKRGYFGSISKLCSPDGKEDIAMICGHCGVISDLTSGFTHTSYDYRDIDKPIVWSKRKDNTGCGCKACNTKYSRRKENGK